MTARPDLINCELVDLLRSALNLLDPQKDTSKRSRGVAVENYGAAQ
jgi:hypothetical protein